jgi:subtilase family serine protease
MDDTPLTSELITRLDAGASVNGTCTWKVTNGRHTFRAIANYNNYIVESDKTNNENSIVFAPRLPDLVITSIMWSPHDIPAGNDVIFDINIENQGLLSAGPSRIAYYVDGADAGYTYIGQLEAGASTIEHFKWAASGGQHTINIVLDSTNQIVEIDETNNIKVINIPLPDLVVQDITFMPTDAPIGDTVVITASVKNQGGSKTENSLINLYIDGIKIASEELPQIDTGDSITKTFNWVAEAGVHTFKITADINNTVIEVNETNNEKEIRFTTMTPDLIVDGISWLSNNDESTFTITVKNMGTGTAGASQVKYSFDGAPADIKDLGPIQAGETAQFSFIAILSQGSHTAYITADYNNNIIELDENNNNSVISFSTLAPDLIIRTITYSPLDAKISDNITITAKVENRGTAQASNLRIALSIDGSMVDYIDIPEMKIAAITTVEFTWEATEGQHEITVFADADQTIVESNELNNSKSRTISFEKTKAPVKTTSNTTTAPASDGGFISSWWWLLLLIAGLLGVVAFLPTLRSLIKK